MPEAIAPKQVSLVFVDGLLMICQVVEEWRSLRAIIFLLLYYTRSDATGHDINIEHWYRCA
ncbi:hypothetical protein [Dapis sp. BLCC M229]|uniref:hypothetical protein n=1 Tax=Dapis sp. BLCC M229 TaxID=3400188 RepID=UPI003CF45E7F